MEKHGDPTKKARCDERADPNTPSSVKVGYFGYKVLAVSYGGRMFLNGAGGPLRREQ